MTDIANERPTGALAEQPAAAERPATRVRRSALLLAISTLSVLTVLGVWYISTERGWVSPVFLPKPGRVINEGFENLANGQLGKDIWMSTQRVLLGFALAGIVAIPLGVIMAVWAPAKAAMDPFVSLLRPLPSITWIPLTMLWLGIGEGQKVAIVFMGSWIYILLYTVESTRRVDPLLIRAARNLGASDVGVMLHVILPGALPGIIAGLKVTLAISWSCVLSAEMIAAQNGLGALIWQGKDWGNLALVLVGMLCISLVVLVTDKLANMLERLLLPWERHQRT
ncbi:ABC transporter permease [Bradyrhizobium sp. LHD-71]|uniref:ABC transporter permease n=1 Tax=Bradyrhizobium sp. LHD-71 TaxID=3072141 RepID=UPI00280D42A0|nr:ABC transporter permease [Bradyrhizobium sp. LHD-71]MDQ8728310.1 ABC transporter permease [Bradyrhizobium sp. LHD-71]